MYLSMAGLTRPGRVEQMIRAMDLVGLVGGMADLAGGTMEAACWGSEVGTWEAIVMAEMLGLGVDGVLC